MKAEQSKLRPGTSKLLEPVNDNVLTAITQLLVLTTLMDRSWGVCPDHSDPLNGLQ